MVYSYIHFHWVSFFYLFKAPALSCYSHYFMSCMRLDLWFVHLMRVLKAFTFLCSADCTFQWIKLAICHWKEYLRSFMLNIKHRLDIFFVRISTKTIWIYLPLLLVAWILIRWLCTHFTLDKFFILSNSVAIASSLTYCTFRNIS